MLSNKAKRIIAALCLGLFLIPLTACLSEQSYADDEILLQKPDSSDTFMTGNMVEVALGTISRNASGEASLLFPMTRKITSNLNNARLLSVNVKRGDDVKKGDVIAEFSIEYNESDLNAMVSELSIAEKQYEVMKSSYVSGVTAAEDRLASLQEQLKASPTDSLRTDIKKAEISLKKAKSSYNFFVYEQQRSLSSLRTSIDKFKSNIDNNKIYAPFDGVVGSSEYLPVGNVLPVGTEICTIYSKDVTWVSTTSDISNGMRYNSHTEITVSVVDDVYAGRIITAPDLFGQSTGRVIVIPDKPIDINPGDRMRRLSVIAPRYQLDNVLVLPSAAVYNEDGRRYVYLYEDGIMKKRYVTIGMSSINTVQILEGLTAGQKVVLD